MADILTGTPPDLTYAHDLVRQAWMVVWAVTVRRPYRDPRLDGADPHHVRAPGQPAGGLAGNGPPPGARPRGRRVVAVVVRPGPGHRRRRVRLRCRLPERHRRRHAAVHPPHPDDGGGGRERGHGPAPGRPLPGLRLLRPLRHRADGAAPGPHRHPAGPGAHRAGAVDIAPHGGLGKALAQALHDDHLPAGHPAHRVGPGLRVPQRGGADSGPSSRCRT